MIEWVTSGDYASTSYIQSDPLTGQILHAHIFVLRETMMDGSPEQQNDHLRDIVAHEVGHALGLRHNFAPGPVTTVMGYFELTQILRIGRDIRAGKPALPYDRQVIRYVYLGEPLDLDALPPFCGRPKGLLAVSDADAAGVAWHKREREGRPRLGLTSWHSGIPHTLGGNEHRIEPGDSSHACPIG